MSNAALGHPSSSFTDQLDSDIEAALNVINLTIGSWGGSMYFWNAQFSSAETVADAIENSSTETQLFITNNAQAAADTIKQFGLELADDPASLSAFKRDFQNLATGNWEAKYIGIELAVQLSEDVGVTAEKQFMQWLNVGSNPQIDVAAGNDDVVAGSGSDVLVGSQGLAGAGNDTLVGGGGNDTFVIVQPTSGSVTETISDLTGDGQVVAFDAAGDISYLGGIQNQPLTAVAGTPSTWMDEEGTTYQFDSLTGDLTISGGLLQNNNEVVIDTAHCAMRR